MHGSWILVSCPPRFSSDLESRVQSFSEPEGDVSVRKAGDSKDRECQLDLADGSLTSGVVARGTLESSKSTTHKERPRGEERGIGAETVWQGYGGSEERRWQASALFCEGGICWGVHRITLSRGCG